MEEIKKPQLNENLKTKVKKTPVFNIVNIVITFAAHITFILLAVFSYQYYGLSKGAFVCALGVIVCLLLVSDLLLFVGNNYRDKTIRIVNCVLASILLIVSGLGAFMMGKVNSTVNKVVENSGVEQYETISAVFVSYDKEYEKLEDLKDLKVGILYETNVGTGSIAKQKLDKAGVNCNYVDLSSINDLFYGLVDGNIDVAVMPASYRQLFENDENYDYTNDLEKMHEFYSFSEKVLVAENENANKDLTAEPFNILLIGFAQNSAESPYGLADTIIVASVNPQTMTVTLTSIARDSYVPISCYGGYKDKINAARGTSRACLLETVSDLVDMDIDFYMEVNFKAVVEIVDALGGIMIDSPVQFVGQNSSYTRGEMTVLVTQGPHMAMGEEALAFARERHAMPGGDFDRQQHQQEVIKEVAKGLVELRDVSKALKVMEACGENISTNLSVNQLTTVFNYIVSAPNYLDVNQFDVIDIQNMRLTGYSSWHYNEQLSLPVWIYKLYNGSLDETLEVMNETLGNYSEINQKNRFYFFSEYPYNRGRMYSLSFNESEIHEDLPLYCPYLTSMTYNEVVAWASENGLKLSVTTITSGSSGYDASLEGAVVDQGTRYGTALKAGDTVYITVMGTVNTSDQIPNFVGQSYLEAVKWAEENKYEIVLKEVQGDGKSGTVKSQDPAAGLMKNKYSKITIEYYPIVYGDVDASILVGKTKEDAQTWVKDYMAVAAEYLELATDDESKVGKIASATFSNGTSKSKANDNSLSIVIYVKAETKYTITVVADPSGGGTVTGGGSYAKGTSVTLTATPADGYTFDGWVDEVAEATRTIIVGESDVTYTAKFKTDESDPPTPPGPEEEKEEEQEEETEEQKEEKQEQEQEQENPQT